MGCATIALQFTQGIIKSVNINVDLNGTIGNKNSKRRENIPAATSWDKEVSPDTPDHPRTLSHVPREHPGNRSHRRNRSIVLPFLVCEQQTCK